MLHKLDSAMLGCILLVIRKGELDEVYTRLLHTILSPWNAVVSTLMYRDDTAYNTHIGRSETAIIEAGC